MDLVSTQTNSIFPDSHVHKYDVFTAASCLVATSPSESLPNVGEKPNQSKRFLLPKREYGRKTIVKRAFQQQLAMYTIYICS